MILQEEYNVNLSQQSKKNIKVSQYDTGRQISVSLLKNDGSMFAIPPETTAMINGKKPDGTGFTYECSIVGNKVLVDMKDQMTVLSGNVKCEIVLSKDKERIATANFILDVEESPISEKMPVSETDLPLLQKAIEASITVLAVEKSTKLYAEQANNSMESASESANSASESAKQAEDSATQAGVYASNALDSSTNAKQSETNAKESESNSEKYAELSKSASEEAVSAKSEAKNSEANADKFASSARESATSASESAESASDSANIASTKASEAEKSAEESKKDYSSVQKDIENSKNAIAELNDKKITKFYASNLGEVHIVDSDKGLIQDMCIFGKLEQTGTPSVDVPAEIKSVVNPTIDVVGSNLLNPNKINNYTYTHYGLTITYIGDSKVHISGTYEFTDGSFVILETSQENISGKGYNIKGFFVEGDNKAFSLYGLRSKDEKVIAMNTYGWNMGDKINMTIQVMVVQDSEPTAFAPYTEQFITLPYTLNAIPVSSYGNVTINGQQYISDYIDVKNGKLVQMVNCIKLAEYDFRYSTTPINKCDSFETGLKKYSNMEGKKNLCELFPYFGIAYDQKVDDSRIFTWNNTMCIQFNQEKGINSIEKLKALFDKNPNASCYYVLKEPQEIDLMPEQIKALKQITTYYPVTNLFVTSDQLDGYIEFNYPISLANGWNYVKQQLNDNRDYIYDMNLDMAEAYVNSEYAVALAELNEDLEDDTDE